MNRVELITPDEHCYFRSYKELSDYLTDLICQYCAGELLHDIPSSVMLEMSNEEWAQEMLTAQCGAEWFVEEEGFYGDE